MSIEKRNIEYPDVLQTLSLNTDKYRLTECLFITPESFSWRSDEFEVADFWYSNLGTNIIPLQGVLEFNPEDEEMITNDSLQDFTYKLRDGRYRHRLMFDWSLDYHNLVSQFSGQKVRVVYASGNVLRAYINDADEVYGLLTNTFELEKIKFTTINSTGNSNLLIELNNALDLNYEVEVDWSPKLMDRLVVNIQLIYGESTITLRVKYNSENITGISASDITITDDIYGDITFSQFEPGEGVYVLGGFSDNLVSGCLSLQSSFYIGAKRYNYKFTAQITQNLDFIDGTNFELISGDNLDLIDKI